VEIYQQRRKLRTPLTGRNDSWGKEKLCEKGGAQHPLILGKKRAGSPSLESAGRKRGDGRELFGTRVCSVTSRMRTKTRTGGLKKTWGVVGCSLLARGCRRFLFRRSVY